MCHCLDVRCNKHILTYEKYLASIDTVRTDSFDHIMRWLLLPCAAHLTQLRSLVLLVAISKSVSGALYVTLPRLRPF